MSATLPPALVLTAGVGSRLDPLTQVRAKPAVPLAGSPVVVRILRWLAAQGVSGAVLNLHHRPETITRIVGYGRTVGLPVRYSWEQRLLGSAGGPRRARPLLDDRFFIVNGDTLVDFDLRSLLDRHRQTAAEVTMAVTDQPAGSRHGGVVADPVGRITGFVGAGTRGNRLFVGVQLVEARVFDPVADDVPSATVGQLYDRLITDRVGRIMSHSVVTRFLEVGTPDDYLEASLSLEATEGTGGRPRPTSRISASAELVRTVVWDGVSVGPDCRLEECVLTDDVHLPGGTVADRCIFIQRSTGVERIPLPTAASPPSKDLDGDTH